ncbi:MAG: hypothetical protein IPG34_04965 [Rhodocyclaceae bacterium]|nr:hypothetical protein [Rhodocyclaceae bacterium]
MSLLAIFRSVTLLALGIVYFPACVAHAADKVLDANQFDGVVPVSLTEYFSVLEDPEQVLTLEEVLTPQVAARFKGNQPAAVALSFNFTRSAFWLRLTLRNSGDEPLERMLEIGHAAITSVQLHQPGQDGTWRSVTTGSGMPFATRAYPHHYFVFPVTLPAHSDQVMYLRVQSTDALLVPARLWDSQGFRDDERRDYIGQAWYYGMVTAMVLFNLLLFVALRDGIYLLYVAVVVCMALGLAARLGIANEFLWPQAGWWADIAHFIGYSISIIGLLFFMRRMLDTPKQLPKCDKVIKVFIGMLALTLIGILTSLQAVAEATALLYLVATVVILGIGLTGAYHRQRTAITFVAAYSALLLGGPITVLRSLGILPTNLITINAMQFGSAIEMILLAFALADRFNGLRREKDLAQSEMLRAQTKAFEAEHREVEALRSSERLLEGRVKERTAELSATILRLKQTQEELVQAEKLASLGGLVAGVAHELNTPLGTMLTTASTLEDSTREFQGVVAEGGLRRSALDQFLSRAAGMSALLVRSCHRAANLIASFKQVAVDQTSEKQRAFDLRALIDDNVASLRPNLKLALWTIDVTVPDGITCDSFPGPLGQVIVNLIQNVSVHAFEPGARGVLRISASVSDGMVELLLADDGKGMTPETLGRIFEPFFTTRLGQGGSGLGLVICRNIVTGILGGTLQASSAPGQGSRFVIRFPGVARSNDSRPGQE